MPYDVILTINNPRHSYLIHTVGNITEENVKEYILKQAEESKKEERQAQRPL